MHIQVFTYRSDSYVNITSHNIPDFIFKSNLLVEEIALSTKCTVHTPRPECDFPDL